MYLADYANFVYEQLNYFQQATKLLKILIWAIH